MDKYPVFQEEQAVGELTVAPDALYTAFSVSCRGQEGLWCAWAVGETGESPYRCSGAGEWLLANPPPVFQTVDGPVGHPSSGENCAL